MSLDSPTGNRILPPELSKLPAISIPQLNLTIRCLAASHGRGAREPGNAALGGPSPNSLLPVHSSGNTSEASSVGMWSATMDLTSIILPGQVPAPDTSGSVQGSESIHSAPASPLSPQP
ncbi:hypothetical protein C0995_003546, partial [Termitomyces sp. Mi166